MKLSATTKKNLAIVAVVYTVGLLLAFMLAGCGAGLEEIDDRPPIVLDAPAADTCPSASKAHPGTPNPCPPVPKVAG